MADKFRRTFPLKITFPQGERPSNQKLTAVSEQSRNAMALIEKVVGDTWNQAGDTVLTSYPLLIPTIARMIGQNKYLNPVIYPMDGDFQFTESIGEKYIGRNEFHLTYKPKDGTATLITCTGTSISGSPQTNERDVDASGEYWVDNDTGRFRSYVALSGDETITYTVDTTEWIIGEETLPGVIPDPRQADFTSCRIEESGAKFYVHLPPRLPLTLDSDRERPASYPSSLSSEITANSASDTSYPQKFWQQSTINALTGAGSAHYRYALPTELQEAFAGGDIALGEEIPKGFLYLYDADNNVLLEDVVFKRPLSGDTGYTLEVSSDTFDFSEVTGSDNESEATYNASGLILVTCGSPLSRVLWLLMSTLFKHKHEKGQTLDATVSHSDLDNTNPPSADYAIGDGHNSRYPTHLPSWFPSNWSHDTHTSLLSRAGAQTDSERKRDKFNNAMLGHLVLANADTSGSENYLDDSCPDNSFKLYFGNINGPNVYSSSGDIVFRVDGTSNEIMRIQSDGKIGIGVSLPSEKLSVYNGKFLVSSPYTSSIYHGGIKLIPGTASNLNRYLKITQDTINSEKFLFQVFASSEEVERNSGILSFLSGGGQVGIGTDDPEQSLHIYHATDNFVIGAESGSDGAYIGFKDGISGSWDVAVGCVGDEMALYSGGTETIRIDNSGKVGIGTSDPSYKLQISTTGADGIWLRDSNSNTSAPSIRVTGKRGDGNQSQAFAGKLALEHHRTDAAMDDNFYGNLGSIIFGANHTNGTESNIAYPASISAIAEGTFSDANTMPTSLVFRTGSVGQSSLIVTNVHFGTERMRIDSNGYVGINTTEPQYNLDCNGIGRFTENLRVGDSTAAAYISIKASSTTDSYIYLYSGSNYWTLKHDQSSSNELCFQYSAANKFIFETGGNMWAGGFVDALTIRANDYYWEALDDKTRYIYFSPGGALGDANEQYTEITIDADGAVVIPISLPQYSEIETIEVYVYQAAGNDVRVQAYRSAWNSGTSIVVGSEGKHETAGGQLIIISGINHTIIDGNTYVLRIRNTSIGSVATIYGGRITITETRVPVYNYTI